MNPENVKDIEKRVEELVNRVIKGTDYVLVDVSLKGLGGRKKLEIALDRPGGITLDECEKLSNEISLLLDSEDLIEGPYILEVGSPGLDRVIKTERELTWAKGKKVKVFMKDKEVLGVLKDFDNEWIFLENGEKLNRQDILKIKVNEV